MPTLKQNEAANLRAVGNIRKLYGNGVLRNYQIALASIRQDMATLYEKYGKAGILTRAEMSKYNRLKAMRDNMVETLSPVFRDNGRKIETMAEDVYQASFYRNDWAIDQKVGARLNWGLLNPEVVKSAVQNPISGLTLHGLTSQQRRRTLMGINRAITQGLIKGTSYQGMVTGVKKFLDGDAARAMTTIRTEGQRAYVEGQLASAQRAETLGVDVRRVWDATLDARTRPEHGALDGVAAGGNGLFDTAVGPVRGPTLSGDPAFDINCRCRVFTEVVGFEPKERRVRDEGIVPYQTYNQWVADKPKLAAKLAAVKKRSGAVAVGGVRKTA